MALLKQFSYLPQNNEDESSWRTITGDIIKFGIQTLPGTIFNLNNQDITCMVGNTGIYELEVYDDNVINSIEFSENSLENIQNSNGGYLIVDVIAKETAVANP